VGEASIRVTKRSVGFFMGQVGSLVIQAKIHA
jgi:hypothetical protein